jgi:hypothetical protein
VNVGVSGHRHHPQYGHAVGQAGRLGHRASSSV